MRLLIDECVDERIRFLFQEHDCRTARYANLAGLKNGRLLDAAEAAGFEVLITVDQSMPDQPDLRGRRLSILILCARTNRISGGRCSGGNFRLAFDPAGPGCDGCSGMSVGSESDSNWQCNR